MTSRPAGALSVTGLTVTYGSNIANVEVNLEVGFGEVVGLIGPNGAGKTSFVDAVTGFVGSKGTVLLRGTRIDHLPAFRRRRAGLSRTWQAGELFANLSVTDNLRVADSPRVVRDVVGDLLGRSSKHQESLDDVMRLVGLDSVSHILAQDLSLGLQKLVGVARSLVNPCSVVLLDEPAAGLDDNETALFATRLRAVAEAGKGVLLIDHDTNLVFNVCDRVYVMDFGQIIFEGTPQDARTNSKVVESYLGTDAGVHIE